MIRSNVGERTPSGERLNILIPFVRAYHAAARKNLMTRPVWNLNAPTFRPFPKKCDLSLLFHLRSTPQMPMGLAPIARAIWSMQ